MREKTLTTGTGPIQLGNPVGGFIQFHSAFSDQDQVHYSIIDGDDRENGVGIYNAQGNTISRVSVLETFVNGSYQKGRNIPALSLSGSAFITCMASTFSTTSAEPMWKVMYPSTGLAFSDDNPPTRTILVGNIKVKTFPVGQLAEFHMAFNIPHDVSRTEKLIPFVHWAPSTADAGAVRWGLEYSLGTRGDQLTTSTDIGIVAQSSGVAESLHHDEVFEADQIAPQLPESVVLMRIYRNSNNAQDTYPGDAHLLGIGMSYLCDRTGTPRRDPDFYSWS